MPIAVVEHYYQMIQHLDNADKMILVEKIIHSVNNERQSVNNQESLAGSWEDDRSADEIIQDIKANAHMQRHIESFE
ncbi:hypothetical protein IM753_01890 [Moraxella sp. K127]|uniref:hypothetical protein n=1 Tax=Moraxella TaxID=475 RepID=UPI00187F7224|nr:hypothetical protein [Moraxella sp. K127]MBE9589742.1 hypothetical protein [Moraxella sp. K127]